VARVVGIGQGFDLDAFDARGDADVEPGPHLPGQGVVVWGGEGSQGGGGAGVPVLLNAQDDEPAAGVGERRHVLAELPTAALGVGRLLPVQGLALVHPFLDGALDHVEGQRAGLPQSQVQARVGQHHLRLPWLRAIAYMINAIRIRNRSPQRLETREPRTSRSRLRGIRRG
jgi:hypothetical protein